METQIRTLYKPLFLYVRKRIKNQEDAEDITQEVFYKLSKSKNEDINNVKSWVYTIAKNTITDHYRKRKIYTEEIKDNLLHDEYIDSNAVRELSRCISAYVNQLPEDYKQVMTLSELEGVSQKEIAQRLDLNYVTVRSKIQRGRKKLKDIFSACCKIEQGGKGSIMGYQPKEVCEEGEPDCTQKKTC